MAMDSNLELETSIARFNGPSIVFLEWGNVTMMTISIIEDGGTQWISTSRLSHHVFWPALSIRKKVLPFSHHHPIDTDFHQHTAIDVNFYFCLRIIGGSI